MDFEIITKALLVKPVGEPIYHEGVTEISIDDEVGGAFVVVRQFPDEQNAQGIKIDQDEWPLIKQAIELAIEACKELNKEKTT